MMILKSKFFFFIALIGVYFFGTLSATTATDKIDNKTLQAIRTAKRIKIIVDESYGNDRHGNAIEVGLPFESITKRVLSKHVGLTVVEPQAEVYDM